MTATTGEPRSVCLRCHRAASQCLCGDLPSVDNRTGIVILQHRRERFHPVGSAPIARLGLRRCRVEVVHGDDERRMRTAVELPPRTALLYPRDDARDLADLAPAARPEHLLVLDGTWPQARRLYLDNPRLAALPHVTFTVERPSAYRVRRPPRREYLSTIESIVTALRILEPDTPGLDGLFEAFVRMNDRQSAFMTGATGGSQPRHQRPRQRPVRRIPTTLHQAGVLVAYGELAQVGSEPQLLQWSAADLDDDARRFEALIRPTGGEPSPNFIHHTGVSSTSFASGETLESAVHRFREFAGDRPVLAAWNRRTLQLAREHLDQHGPEIGLKAAYTNVRGGHCGSLDDIVAREGLSAAVMPFTGRAGSRIGSALAVARWLRTMIGLLIAAAGLLGCGSVASPDEAPTYRTMTLHELQAALGLTGPGPSRTPVEPVVDEPLLLTGFVVDERSGQLLVNDGADCCAGLPIAFHLAGQASAAGRFVTIYGRLERTAGSRPFLRVRRGLGGFRAVVEGYVINVIATMPAQPAITEPAADRL